MKIILISGKARHGKDTVANILRDNLENIGYRVQIVHYADLLKFICKTYFEWDGEKDEAGRNLLQYVGTDKIRGKDSCFFVNFIGDFLSVFDCEWDYVIIPDCRFHNEVSKLKEWGFDTVHLKVIRPNYNNGLTAEQRAHPSETELDNVRPDIYIINDGDMDDLRRLCTNKLLDKLLELH